MHTQHKRWLYVKPICISSVDTATTEGYGGDSCTATILPIDTIV
jgi:hypothetical protein